MMTLLEEYEKYLPKNIRIPWELKELFQWLEEKGYYNDSPNGKVGFLHHPSQELGTWIDFYPEPDSANHFIFDSEKFIGANPQDRFFIFCQTGGDGSVAALWLNDNNELKIVHVGSGSGSGLLCVLADKPLDFIRLIAIGYEEICWNENYDVVPDNEVNLEFQSWVKSNFKTTIPSKASEIVKIQSEIWDEKSDDEFHSWFVKYNDNYI